MADSDTPESSNAYREAVQHLVRGEPDRAVALLEPLVEAEPRFEPTLALGKAYLELGRSDEAAGCFERLLAGVGVDPGARAYLKLMTARAHILSGGRDDAVRELDEAARIDSRLGPAVQALRQRVERSASENRP